MIRILTTVNMEYKQNNKVIYCKNLKNGDDSYHEITGLELQGLVNLSKQDSIKGRKAYEMLVTSRYEVNISINL